jgi:hypothetical protein
MWKSSVTRPPKGLVIVLATFLTMMVVVAGTTHNPSWANPAKQNAVSEPTLGQESGDPATWVNESDSSASQSLDRLVRPQRHSRRQVRTLVGNARPADDHATLAAYFQKREREFRAKEAAQQKVLSEYLKDETKDSSKYPTRGATARDLAVYGGMQAQKDSHLALEHEKITTELRAQK